MLKKLLVFSFLFITLSLGAQGVKFRSDYWLEKAIQIAKIEDKIIFIDTYTPWCGPCKLMDIQLQDEALGAYFNEKFINIKINMDSPYGEAIKTEYDVFFLPTLLIIDKHGNMKYASEGTLTSDELLAIGSHHYKSIYKPEQLKQKKVVAKRAPVIIPELIPNPKIEEIQTIEIIEAEEKQEEDPIIKSPETISPASNIEELLEDETILYTLNDSSNDPEFLYNLTYLKLQLQDGTQWATARQYLETQKDWSTQKNMKFIYDFVRQPRSKMFDHIIDNRLDYELLFGKENVQRSISIMVNMRLNQGFPRPDFEEAKELYTLLDNQVAEVAAYHFCLERFEIEEKYKQYVDLALQYIETQNPDDFNVINNIGMYYEAAESSLKLKDAINMLEHAIEVQGGTYYKLYVTLASLYFKKGKKKKARVACETAYKLALQSGVDVSDIRTLQKMIESL